MEEPEKAFIKHKELKDAWYSLIQSYERLSQFDSCLNDKFKDELKSAILNIENCKRILESFEITLNYFFPAFREKIHSKILEISSSLNDLNLAFNNDLKNILRLKKLVKKLQDKEEYLLKAERQLREVENQTSEICNKYFERRKEYKIAEDKINTAISRKISEIRDEFEEKVSTIVSGYEIYIEDRVVDTTKLFEILVDKPSIIEKIDLKPLEKKLFGSLLGRSQVDVAKTIVLRHEAGSIIEKTYPIKEAGQYAMKKLKEKFSDLNELESSCKSIEKRRESLLKAREVLSSDISQLKNEPIFSYTDPKKILELRELYFEKLSIVNSAYENFLSFVKGLLIELEEEPDPEKRELVSKIKELEKEKIELQSKLEELKEKYASLQSDFEEKVAKIEETSALELEECKKRLDKITHYISEMEKELKKHFDILLDR